jgi:hypothetical protein
MPPSPEKKEHEDDGGSTMNRHFFVTAAIAFALASASQMQAQPTIPHYTSSEIKKMIQEARTAPQYQSLAQYFRSRQQEFEKQAASEKVEWDRRSQNVKYPRPVDSSKNRYEYFEYEAQQMNQQATHFEDLSAKVQP